MRGLYIHRPNIRRRLSICEEVVSGLGPHRTENKSTKPEKSWAGVSLTALLLPVSSCLGTDWTQLRFSH